MDLEELARAYRHRPASAAALERPVRALHGAGLGAGHRALDVGGGTGAHAVRWAEADVIAVLVDPSRAMTQEAVRRSLFVVRAAAEALPFTDGAFGLVYFHLSIHHTDWRRALAEAARVLRSNGEVWIWTLGAEHHRTSFLARWFPSVVAIDTARFPEPATLVDSLGDVGLELGTIDREDEVVQRRAGAWQAAVEAGFISTLQLLEPSELSQGLASFRRVHPDPDEMLSYRLRYSLIVCRRASLP